jgi:hypothetical protein
MAIDHQHPDPERRLRVFLCHSSGDKPAVRDLYRRLKADGFAPWLDEEELLPGQDWQQEIPAAVRACDVVIICLSQKSVSKEGYLQREIRDALYVAEEKPEGTIFVIPVKLEEVEVPQRLSQWQWANLFQEGGYQRLVRALQVRAKAIGATVSAHEARVEEATRPGLRCEPATLSREQAKVMVVAHDFYCAGWNESGKGVAHLYETKVFHEALFVVDHATGLMWQRGGSGSIVSGGLHGAENYVRGLNAKKSGGFADWRLPTLEEAMSLMTTRECGQPGETMVGDEKQKGLDHIDRVFEKAAAYFIWTADLESPGRGWVVYFWDGICADETLDFNGYVRAVRSEAV